jgi:two-component system catabolic regulation response regulator CreB
MLQAMGLGYSARVPLHAASANMSSPPMVLLVEDDPAIADMVVYALRREGMAVMHLLLVGEARQWLQGQKPGVLVLDLGLPDGNGLDLCRELRQSSDPALRGLPVLMLSARGEELDRVLGLEMGADDYLTKPFSPRELVARIRALLRRSALTPNSSVAQRFECDSAGQRIRYGGVWLSLTRLEYGLLRTLLAAPTRIHSRAALLDAVWGHQSEANDRTVDTHIKTLRAKLREQVPGQDPILTHRGLGYGLAEEV